MTDVPITDGYRLYIGADQELHLDLIKDGMVYALVPSEAMDDMALGYYDKDFELVHAEEE